jgi:serine/threonine protein kinase
MSTPGQRPSSSSRDLTLVVESESGTPEEYFAQVGLSIGRANSNTIHIDHPDVDRIHAKVVKREESYWLRCEGQAKLKVLDPEPGEVEEVELTPGLTIQLGGVIIRCRRQMRGMSSLSDDYWADAAGGERFRVEADSFTGDLPKKIGPYEIRKFVARGGMGIVLRGIHQDTDQPAAVKLPTPDLNKDEQWLKRFEQEVRTLKSVTHPNLVRLQDAGKEGDLHWMAMDWVEGGTVANRIAKAKDASDPIGLYETQQILLQVVGGLNYLHSRNVVHRDLKPGNLLVGQDGGVKVADFGLAKQVGGEQSTFLTRTGTFAGTMHYMAPEQAEGMDITPATDVYALGVIWHELLTGKRPGAGKFKLQKLCLDCPDSWVNIVEECLDDEPADRPELDAIKQVLEAERFEAAIPPTELEQEDPRPITEPETEQEQIPHEELEPESVMEVEEPEPEAPEEDPLTEYEADEAEAEEPIEIEEEPEPVAAVGGYSDGYTAEPESKKAGSKIPLVMCGMVGLAILWALFGGGGSKEDPSLPMEDEFAQAIEPTTPEPTAPEPPEPPVVVKKTDTPIWEFETGGGVASSPAIGSDGTVYVGSVDKKLYAINGKSGVKLWEFETGDGVFSSPAIGSDGTVYVGSGYADTSLYAINGKSGVKLWEFETGDDVYSSPAIGSDGTVYVGSNDNMLYAINGKSGVKLWAFKTGGAVRSSPAIGSDGTVYVGSFDGKLYAIKTESLGLAKSPWPMRGQNARHTGRVMKK